MEEFIDVNNGNGLSKEEFDKYFRVVKEDLKLDEKISSELAQALHLSYGRGHHRIDWEHSDIKQITKAEARKEYENGNKENLIIAERDGDGDLRIMAANGNRWGWRGSGSFRDALRDGTEFYLIANRVENPEKPKDRLIPGGDTGDHHPYNPWRDKNDERDWKAGRIDQFHSNHGLDPTGRHYVDSRNRYAASLADLQKHVDEYKELKQRLAWVKKESDWITAHQSNYKSADKLNKEKEKKMQKIKDEISYLQQELDRLEKAPLDTADNRLQVCNDKIAELTSQINTILKRPQSTAEGLNEDSHTVQLYKDWINEPTFAEDKDDVIEDIKNNKCLTDGEKLELFTMINNKNESLNEALKGEIPWVLQQGEDGDLEYLGFFKNRDDALASYDPTYIYEDTYINELDKDTYLAMRDEHEFNYKEEKELNAFFDLNDEPTTDKYGNRYFVTDAFDHSIYRGAFNTFETAKQTAERMETEWKVRAFNYETDEWETLAQSEPQKNEEFKDYNPDDVPEDDTVDYEDHILRTNEDYYDDDEEEEEEGFDPVNPPVNLYDYLKENSNGAWISFSFDLGDGADPWENYCHGIGDFRDPELLKQYEVTGESASGFSQSQGTHYDLEIRKIGSNKKTTEHEDWTKELFDAIADGHGYSLKRNDIPAFIEKGKEFGYEWLYINNRLYLKGRDDYRLVSDAANGILNDLRLMANDINYSSYYRWNNKTKLNDIVEISNWGKWEDNKLSRNDQDILDKLINTQNNKFGVNITAEYPGNNKIILHLNNK